MKNKFKRIKSLILILLLTLMTISTNIRITKAEALDSDIVTFEDANLEAVVRKKLAKASGDITVGDMRSMTGEFCAHEKNVNNLKGLEHAVNIESLCLYGNQISDITSLKDMTSLQGLDLNNNQISDITPLKGMTNLGWLYLDNNQISDITPLKGIINLTDLNLSCNQVNDISSLKNMKNLEILALYNNQISDITSLKGMTNLGWLYLDNNQISDITPLKGIINLTDLNLSCNQVNDISSLKDITNLRYLYLYNNQISDITPLKDMLDLAKLWLDNNQISDISALGNLLKLEVVNLGNNQISDISSLSNNTALIRIYLKNNKIKSIPDFIGSFSNLKTLDIRNNYLIGEVPSFFDNLTNLKYWDGYEQYTSFSGNYLTGTVSSTLKNRLGEEAFYNNLLEGETNQKQLTLLPGAELNLSLNSIPTQNTLRSVVQLYDGEDSHSKSLYELELVPTDESFFDENGRAIKSGTTTAYIKLKDVADTNPYAKTLTPVQVNISDKIGCNNDINIDFSIDNALEVTLGTNNINFGVVSSIGGEIETTTLTVTSSLPYDISTKAYGDFTGNSDSSNIMPIEKVSLDIDDLGYMELSKEKVLNLEDNPSAIDKVHNLNFKISDTLGYKKDNYRAELQFIIDTK